MAKRDCTDKLFCCADVFHALKNVETPGVTSMPWPRGGAGEIGPYQILPGYWQDAFLLDLRRPRLPIPSPANCPGCGGTVLYPWLEDDALGGIPLSEEVICRYMNRYARAEKSRLQACRGTIADVEKVLRIHNGGPKGYTRNSTIPYWTKAKRILGC